MLLFTKNNERRGDFCTALIAEMECISPLFYRIVLCCRPLNLNCTYHVIIHGSFGLWRVRQRAANNTFYERPLRFLELSNSLKKLRGAYLLTTLLNTSLICIRCADLSKHRLMFKL